MSVFDGVGEWENLRGSETGELLLKLIGDDENAQRAAFSNLDYILIERDADRPENYGNPEVLLKDDTHLYVVAVLARILDSRETNRLSKYLTIYLLEDIDAFARAEDNEKFLYKTRAIREAIALHENIYRGLIALDQDEFRTLTQKLLQSIESTDE